MLAPGEYHPISLEIPLVNVAIPRDSGDSITHYHYMSLRSNGGSPSYSFQVEIPPLSELFFE